MKTVVHKNRYDSTLQSHCEAEIWLVIESEHRENGIRMEIQVK